MMEWKSYSVPIGTVHKSVTKIPAWLQDLEYRVLMEPLRLQAALDSMATDDEIVEELRRLQEWVETL